MAKLPLNISKAVDAWKEASEQSSRSASIVLAGDPRLVGLAQQQFSSGGTLPATWVRPLAELSGWSSVPGELLLIFVSAEGEAEVIAALEQSASKGGVILAVDEGDSATWRTSRPCRGCTRLSFADTDAGWRGMFSLCADTAGDSVVAMGRRYPGVRDAAVRRVIYRTAGQNALIGLAFFMPGTDMPAMTLNQAKMVLSIASIHGEAIDRERAVELAGIVGIGFGLRALARYLVRSTSGIGWLVKASTGYAATVAIGLGTVKYFEKGAPASTSRMVTLVSSLRR